MNFFNDDSNKKPTEGNPVTVSAETEGVPQKPKPATSSLSFFDASQSTTQTLAPEILAELANDVIDVINRDFLPDVLQRPNEKDRAQVNERISVLVGQNLRKKALNPGGTNEREIVEELSRRILGLGFLDLLLPPARTDISEISVYSSGLVQIMKKGEIRWSTVNMRPSPQEIERVLDRILGQQNKSLNETNPSIDAKLARTKNNPGGARVKAIHKAIAPPNINHVIEIRLYEEKPVLPEWILEQKEMSRDMMDTIKEAVSKGKRILVTGETRTGKTTLLSAMCNFLPEGWRILKIEDPEEIWINRETVQTIEARPQQLGTEVKPYTLADGVDDALRLSPDYLVIGEVRGGKAGQALFRALMTGHSGACTFHADNPADAVERFANILESDSHVTPEAAYKMFAFAIDVIVQISFRHEKRIVTEIVEVSKKLNEKKEVCFNPIWKYDENSPADDLRWINLFTTEK